MAKPVVLTVDDDAEVLRAAERDLRREYGNRFRVMRANSGEAALGALRQLKLRNAPVALLLVDQRMPRMAGIEYIEQANSIYPKAKRALHEDVFVVGGANSAGQSAMHLSKYARQVTMLVRGLSPAATVSQYLIDQIAATPNMTVRRRSGVIEAHGNTHLEAITVADAEAETRETLPTKSLFIFIGAEPRTDWLAAKLERGKHGFILSGPDLLRDGRKPRGWIVEREPLLLETGVPGVFVAGDLRRGSVKRVASSVGEGAIAVQFMHQYLSKL